MDKGKHMSDVNINTERRISSENRQSQTRPENNISIDMLNDDCLADIFKFLPIADRLRAERVCKRWKIVSEESWYLRKILHLSPKAFGISNLDTIEEDALEKIMSKCGRYTSRLIYTQSYEQLDDVVLRKLSHSISEYCYNVTSLELTSSNFYPWEIEILAKNCKKIKTLALRLAREHQFEKELRKLFEANKDLENVMLVGKALAPSLMELPEHTIKGIKLADYCRNADFLPSVVERQRNLKFFSLILFTITEDTLQCILKNCKNLEILHFQYFATRDSYNGGRNVRITDQLVNLKCLSFQEIRSDCEWFSFINNFIKACKELVSLNIEDTPITDSDIEIISGLKKLENLNLSGTSVTDNGLQYICGLKKLTFENCSGITDSGVKKLLESSPKLELLRIRDCQNINKDHIAKIVTDACNNRSNGISLKLIL